MLFGYKVKAREIQWHQISENSCELRDAKIKFIIQYRNEIWETRNDEGINRRIYNLPRETSDEANL